MNGVIILNKDKGLTSRQLVNKLIKILDVKKIGHTGTLDPIATGILVVCIGKYTKLVDYLTSQEKEYIATIKLGIKTDTLDITGKILEHQDVKQYSKEELIGVLNSFIGNIEQTVPKYSAVHVNGKRLYEYAYSNQDVELPKRQVIIKNIELISYENDEIKFKVLVSKGTYIRSLIEDICSKLDTIGCMSDLVRTKQGNFDIKNSYTLDDIENNNYRLLNIEELLNPTIINVDESLLKKVSNGSKINDNLNGFVLYKYNNKDLALYLFEQYVGSLLILLNN